RRNLLFAGESSRRPRRVEGDETAADHDDLPPEIHPVAAIDVQQEVHRLDDAVELYPGNLELSPARDADREKDRFVTLLAQRLESRSRREGRPQLQVHAQPRDPLDLA